MLKPYGGVAALIAATLPLSGASCVRAQTAVTPAAPAATAPVVQQTSPGAAPQRFPFVIPWNDALKNVATDMSGLNSAPLTAQSRLVTRPDGHFYSLDGRRVRFVATNVTAGAAFPRKEDAPLVAARLRKLGFNMVRLHHMDAEWASPNLFASDGDNRSKPTAKLDPESMDKLDFFVSELKKAGIYVDLNLHVSRTWRAADGFTDPEKLPELGKVMAYFDERAVALQKDFATQILTHVNPYTKQAYKDDPVIALVELNNEDSLVGSAGVVDGLPARYKGQIERGWNSYLQLKYKNTAKLLAAWNSSAKPLGANLITNGRMENGPEGWVKEQQGASQMTYAVESAAGQTNAPEGRVLHISGIKPDGTNWHLQTHQTGINLKPGEMYTVSFQARANAPRALPVGVRLDQDPWSNVGLDDRAALETRWKPFTFTFTASDGVVPNHARLSFVIGDSADDVYIADVSLRAGGGGVGLASGQTLEAGNLSLPGISPTAPGRDYVAYLMQVEDKYAQGLKTHIQKTIGTRALVACSQASYGGMAGVYRESKMDWVDMHSYWEHPSFPAAAFDPNNYTIGNNAMVKSEGAGTLDGLAMHRVAGKPFTVSEYDHPAPNEFGAEMTPVIFAYAALQDWDGIFTFAWAGDDEDWRSDKIGGFFDQYGNTGKLAYMPWAAQLFLSGALAPAPNAMTLTVPVSQVADMKARGTDYNFWSSFKSSNVPDKKYSARDFLDYRGAVKFSPDAKQVTAFYTPPLQTLIAVPPTFAWDHDKDRILVNTPTAQAIVGIVGGAGPVKAGDLTADIAPSVRNFASLTLAARDNKPVASSSSLLLTAIDKAENPGLKWNATRTSATDAWAKGPIEVEVPTGTVTIKTNLKAATVYALSPDGKRKNEVPSQVASGALTFKIAPEHQTVWYEVVGK